MCICVCIYIYIYIHTHSIPACLRKTASFVVRAVYSVKGHHTLPEYSPLLKKTCVREVVCWTSGCPRSFAVRPANAWAASSPTTEVSSGIVCTVMSGLVASRAGSTRETYGHALYNSGFQGFDSSIILIVRGGIPRPTGNSKGVRLARLGCRPAGRANHLGEVDVVLL